MVLAVEIIGGLDMNRILRPRPIPWSAVFVAANFFATAFAYASYNLFHFSMANINFIKKLGLALDYEWRCVAVAGNRNLWRGFIFLLSGIQNL